MNKVAKFSLSIQTDDSSGLLEYSVYPRPHLVLTQDNVSTYTWEYDPKTILNVSISMIKPMDLYHSKLLIRDLKLNEKMLHDIDTFGVYTLADTKKVEKTYGHMPWPGTYKFRIRFAPTVHEYITFMLTKTKNKIRN